MLKRYQSVKPLWGAADTRKKVRLLYVEDEDLNWEVALLHLREHYDVERASTAAEAFALLLKKPFHAILMDIRLSHSDLDGTEITQALRGNATRPLPNYARDAFFPNLPVIFMTAYAARYSREELLSVGADDVITKPVDFEVLHRCLDRCLGRS